MTFSRSHKISVAQTGQELDLSDPLWKHHYFLSPSYIFVHICIWKSGCVLQMDGTVSDWRPLPPRGSNQRGQRLFTENLLYDSIVQIALDRTAPFMHSFLLRKTSPQNKKLSSSPATLPASGRAGFQPVVPLLVASFPRERACSALRPPCSMSASSELTG